MEMSCEIPGSFALAGAPGGAAAAFNKPHGHKHRLSGCSIPPSRWPRVPSPPAKASCAQPTPKHLDVPPIRAMYLALGTAWIASDSLGRRVCSLVSLTAIWRLWTPYTAQAVPTRRRAFGFLDRAISGRKLRCHLVRCWMDPGSFALLRAGFALLSVRVCLPVLAGISIPPHRSDGE